MILVNEETIEAWEDLLTPTETPSQISTNMDNLEICGHSQAHKIRNGQVMVNQGFLGKAREGSTGMASQSEPLHFQDNYHIIQNKYNP